MYTPALENGYTSETRIPNIDIDAAKQKGVDVKSLSGERLELRNAVERSKNGVAWYIYDDITPDVGMAYLTQMRFASVQAADYYPATSLYDDRGDGGRLCGAVRPGTVPRTDLYYQDDQ